MTIKNEYPPNYKEICEVFDIRNNPDIVFTYGDTIFVPSGKSLSDDLVKHEETHIKQQSKTTPKVWWEQYLTDDYFRLEQEVEAYRNQYQHAVNNYPRPHRRKLLRAISEDLAGPMYGNLISASEAERLIIQ